MLLKELINSDSKCPHCKVKIEELEKYKDYLLMKEEDFQWQCEMYHHI